MYSKKASIITFHCVPNYGAVLQVYALQEVLKELFQTVEIVDYRPQTILNEYKNINTYSLASIITSFYSLNAFLKKKKKFNAFEKRFLNLSSICATDRKELENYESDCLFMGSDQIWNPDITKGYDRVYFGEFGSDSMRKIAYAASIGKKIQPNEVDNIKSFLEKVDHISVRETEAQMTLKEVCSKPVTVVLDPTLLAGKKIFDRMVSPVHEKEYLLLYSLNGYEETKKMAQNIAEHLGINVLEISGRRKLFSDGKNVVCDAGPEEFISYLASAKYVVTDSFHGAVFSLLFHKKMTIIPHKTRGGRTNTLMSSVGLLNRLTCHYDCTLVDESIDWDSIDQLLSEEREKSMNYLFAAIEEDTNN